MAILRIFIFSLIMFVPLQCTAQKQKTATTKNAKTAKTTTLQKIVLQEMTRGTNRIVTITPTTKAVDINGKISSTKTSAEEWNKLVRLASSVDLKSLGSHESPTTGRYSDAALAATLKITSGDKIYESQAFDSGIPPKAFSELYFAVASAFKVK